MSKIVSIGIALPRYKHEQHNILRFMLDLYQTPPADRKRIELLYEHSGIDSRYSVIPDYTLPGDYREFYPSTQNLEPFPLLEKRMEWYLRYAVPLSIQAIEDCMGLHIRQQDITHLITVSCTGMSAPGLDIHILQEMRLPPSLYRTSVNFMGCYAAIHALKIADAICRADEDAKVMIVCTELCTLHFQKEYDMNNIASALLFGDGAAAVLVAGDKHPGKGMKLAGFHSELSLDGKPDMAWNISGKGFLMTLSAYVPQLIQAEIRHLLKNALRTFDMQKKEITHWAIHPGGKKILQAIQRELQLCDEDLAYSYFVLRRFGNMSSPTILFVLKEIMQRLTWSGEECVFAAAFGPGLSMETMMLRS